VTIPPNDSGSNCASEAGGCQSSSGNSSLSGGAIAGIVIGSVVLVLIAGAVAFLILRQRKKAAFAASDPEPDESVLKGPVHKAEPKMTGGSPEKPVSERIAEEHGLELDGDETQIRPSMEMDGATQQIYQLHGESRQPDTEQQVYHELPGTEVQSREPDEVSVVGTLPSRDDDRLEEPSSPFVSTLGTTGWQDEPWEASSDLVSPTTPTHRISHL
jgi:hypothetical protein